MSAAAGPGGLVRDGLGTTESGRSFAFKALHPCGEEITAGAGIPDHVSESVCTPEFRTNTVITSLPSPGASNDDIDIVLLPFPDIPMMWRRYVSGSRINRNANWNVVYNPTNTPSTDYMEITRRKGTSTTLEIAPMTAPIKASSYVSQYARTRGTYFGATVHLDAPTLADQGRIVSAQLAVPYDSSVGPLFDMNGWDATGTYTDSYFGTAELVSLGDIPFDESKLVQAAPGAAVWEAREGVYMPLRFRDPVHNFEATNVGTRYLAIANSDSYITPNATLMVRSTQVSTPPGSATGNTTVTGVAALSVLNFNTGIILVRGISSQANLQIKTVMGTESLVSTSSSISPYQHLSPPLDRLALDRVTEVAQATPFVYPASYNDLSAIINTIKGVLDVVGTPLRKVGQFVSGTGVTRIRLHVVVRHHVKRRKKNTNANNELAIAA